MMDMRMKIFLSLALLACGLLFGIFALYRRFKKANRLKQFSIDVRETEQKPTLFVQLLDQVASMFSKRDSDIEGKFYAAGFYHFKYANLYIPTKFTLLIGCSILIYLVGESLNWDELNSFIFIGIWVVFCLIAPDAYLDSKRKGLQRKLSGQLPYLLDLLAVCVQTGMTIEAAMTYLSKEMSGFDKDLAQLLKNTNDRSRLVGLDRALDELYERVPTNEMRSFTMTLKQSLHYGTSIYGVLTTLAADIRDVTMLSMEEKIGKLAAKMSIPLILFIMMPVVILIAAPGIMRILANA
ncbi:putative Flp pilus assembly protein TadC [Vibrio nigripulchritudo SOn1]|uniref:Flp pilus assembly protein TadC n=2 Tax=Vibrio nigripulchritudo TaxID=28173 RepID=A0AAV2VYF9_9VIBR|nr:putative Flp pilus assembly protein TadC [Vibrio nigripulchritudo SOn1]